MTSLSVGPEASSSQGHHAQLGAFTRPFTEPTINGRRTKEKCVPHEHAPDAHPPEEHGEKELDCKPAASTLSILPGGSALYFNGLEGTDDIEEEGTQLGIGAQSANDQTRVLDLTAKRPRWRVPSPEDGGANPNGYETEPLVPGTSTTETYNDGALFCADVNFLPDGRLLAAGGTAYYNDGGADGVPYGVGEVEGLRNTRIYDPKTNRWLQTGDMRYGRWYPSLVTLGDGRMLVASGVQKLEKPIYRTHPEDSGRNVVQTETFNPKTGKWTYNGESADRSLPLYPRLHLLPNGHVYYNGAGQIWNPFGQAYDQLGWNMAATYDPKARTWTDHDLLGMGTMHPGFRGSTFSIMLPLSPKDGYSKARFLSAGGILGTSPGTYVPTVTSAVTTVDTKRSVSINTEVTGALNEPRWYGTGVALPTGEVLAFNGADRDEVIAPGTGFAVNRTELFDPKTMTWRTVAASRQLRTYHNTAALLPDGRVLVGGHAPLPTLYGSHTTLPGGFSPNDGRDPSFEIYSPPYLFRGTRPRITSVAGPIAYGKSFTITTDIPASRIGTVSLVRNGSITHLVDGDQRVVELKVVSRSGNNLTVAMAPNGNVVPPGPYMLFVNARSSKGPIPSVAKQLIVR